MPISNITNIQNQIWEGIKTLSLEQQYQVLNFIQSLPNNSLFEKWDNISDAEAQALKDEFTQEDIDFAESILPDYISNLEQEDQS